MRGPELGGICSVGANEPYDVVVSLTSEHHVAVIGPFPPIKGGIAQHTARVADAFEDAGCSVERHRWANQYPRLLYRRDEVDRSAPSDSAVEPRLRWFSPLSWVRVGRQARLSELVFFPWVTPVHALPQLLWLWLCRNSLRVVHVHNVTPHESFPFAAAWARLVLGRADLLVCHADSLAADAASLGVRTPMLVTPHPPSISIEPTPLPDSPPTRLLFLGMIRPYKGLDVALDACERLDDVHGLELTVAGEIWSEADRPSAARLARLPMPVTTNFEYVVDEEMVELLRTHHVLLAPYRSATQSGVVSLALAAGRPVVATDVGGLGEVVHEGVNGALSVAGDPVAFAAAVRRVVPAVDSLAAGARASGARWVDYARELLRSVSRDASN